MTSIAEVIGDKFSIRLSQLLVSACLRTITARNGMAKSDRKVVDYLLNYQVGLPLPEDQRLGIGEAIRETLTPAKTIVLIDNKTIKTCGYLSYLKKWSNVQLAAWLYMQKSRQIKIALSFVAPEFAEPINASQHTRALVDQAYKSTCNGRIRRFHLMVIADSLTDDGVSPEVANLLRTKNAVYPGHWVLEATLGN
jgi:hypothetical protein